MPMFQLGYSERSVGCHCSKNKITMCNMGSLSLKEFSENAVLTRISEQSFIEGGTSNVISLDKDIPREV